MGLLLTTFKMKEQDSNSHKMLSDKDYLMGKFDPSKHPDFVKIPAQYTQLQNIYLRKEVLEAFKQMYEAAKKDNVYLTIVSATRNFEYQKSIWDRKWEALKNADSSKKHPTSNLSKAKKILKYSAMPGASRHHWGTDIDLCNLENNFFLTKSGKRIYEWLLKNAHLYGFCQTYTSLKEGERTGYNEEKWHWSYQPTSRVFTENASKILQDIDFQDFDGCETASEIKIVSNYILGINKYCL